MSEEKKPPQSYELHPDVVRAQVDYGPAKELHEKCGEALAGAMIELRRAASGDARGAIAKQVAELEKVFSATGKAMQEAQDALHAALQSALEEAHPELIRLQGDAVSAEAAQKAAQDALSEAAMCGDAPGDIERLTSDVAAKSAAVHRARREVKRYVTEKGLG